MFFCKQKASLVWKMLIFGINEKIPALIHWKLSWHWCSSVYRHALILYIMFNFFPDLVPTIFSTVSTWGFAIFSRTCKDLILATTVALIFLEALQYYMENQSVAVWKGWKPYGEPRYISFHSRADTSSPARKCNSLYLTECFWLLWVVLLQAKFSLR